VRPENGATFFVAEACQDVLLKSVIGAALRRGAEEITPPLILAPRRAIPLLDGIRRVGQDYIELAQTVGLDVPGVGQR
jgi:hypothetical protein